MPDLYKDDNGPTVALRSVIIAQMQQQLEYIKTDCDSRQFSRNEAFMYTKQCMDQFLTDIRFMLLEEKIKNLELFAASLAKKK